MTNITDNQTAAAKTSRKLTTTSADGKWKKMTEDKLLEQLHSQAFDEMEADMLRFVREKQNVEGN